jgi:hypothetical protein
LYNDNRLTGLLLVVVGKSTLQLTGSKMLFKKLLLQSSKPYLNQILKNELTGPPYCCSYCTSWLTGRTALFSFLYNVQPAFGATGLSSLKRIRELTGSGILSFNVVLVFFDTILDLLIYFLPGIESSMVANWLTGLLLYPLSNRSIGYL